MAASKTDKATRSMRLKKGSSLVEVVVAMAVAIVVSFSAASVVLSSSTVTEKAVTNFNAVNEVSNLLECVVANDSVASIENAIVYRYINIGQAYAGERYFQKRISSIQPVGSTVAADDWSTLTYTYTFYFDPDNCSKIIPIQPGYETVALENDVTVYSYRIEMDITLQKQREGYELTFFADAYMSEDTKPIYTMDTIQYKKKADGGL